MEFLGLLLLLILVSLSITSGLGGGIIIVPILLIFYKLELKKAVAISNVIILASSFFKYLGALRHEDPLKKGKTIIDYHIILLFSPIMLMSTVVGGIINKMLPSGFVIILLLIIGVITILISIKNGITRYKSENLKIQKQKEIDLASDEKHGLVKNSHKLNSV